MPFVFYALDENGPAAQGWLRVSHPELDARRTRTHAIHTGGECDSYLIVPVIPPVSA